MASWLLRRLGQALGAAWLLATLVFLLSRQGPAPPEQRALDQADALDNLRATRDPAAGQAAQRERLGLSAPVFYVTGRPGHWRWHGTPNQYHTWLRGLLRGDLGQSYDDGQPVTAHLGPALATSLPLVTLALLLSTSTALPLALYLANPTASARWQRLLGAGLTLVQALPLFALALLLLVLLANPDLLNIVPPADLGRADGAAGALATAGRLVLPLLALVLAALPALTLPLAAALRHELTLPYTVAARAKGLTTSQALRRHALPNAVLPLLAALAELVPTLVAGTVVVEVLFALPGMGRLLAEAATTHNYPVLMAGLLLVIAVRLLTLLAADLVQYRLDPRLRATLAA